MDKLRLDKPLVSPPRRCGLTQHQTATRHQTGRKTPSPQCFLQPRTHPMYILPHSRRSSSPDDCRTTHTSTTFSVIPTPLSVFKLVCISRSEALTSQGSLQSSTPSTAPNSGQMPLSSRQGTQTSQSCTLQSPTLSLLLHSYFSTQLTTEDQTPQSCLQFAMLAMFLHSPRDWRHELHTS